MPPTPTTDTSAWASKASTSAAISISWLKPRCDAGTNPQSIGSIVAHKRGPASDTAPAYVLIGYPNVTRGPGFLGAQAGFIYLTDTHSGPNGFSRPADVDAAAGRVKVIAGTGSNSTAEALSLTAHAKSVGADAALTFAVTYQVEDGE